MQVNDLLDFTYFRGRVALCSILKAMGIGSGDEVATQAFTCQAVPEGIMASGASPMYVDISADGYNFDTHELRKRIGPNTRAIVVQHTFGLPADMPAIVKVGQERGIPVIEDCCHTISSSIDGQPVGTFGDAAFYSFEWGKPIVAGIGGSAKAATAELKARLKSEYQSFANPSRLSQLKLDVQYLAYWSLYRPRWYWMLRSLFHRSAKIGMVEGNYNAVAESQEPCSDFGHKMAPRFRRRLERSLRGVERHAKHARDIAGQYQIGIESAEVTHPPIEANCDTVFARYPLRVTDKPRLLAKARQFGIELAEWYNTPIHPLGRQQAETVRYQAESCPNAEQRASEVVSLPTHRRVNSNYIRRAIEFLQEAA